ncbi:MAG: hypothetical protein E6R04_08040 [Spirochaetes bacterium]|nr:MAG: hypothetical protein E6R04_08040 [Spirochaetota bacterium]
MLTTVETEWRDAAARRLEERPDELAIATLTMTSELAHLRALVAGEKMLDRRAAAEMLDVSVDQVTILVDSGLLPACVVSSSRGRRILRFTLDQLHEFTKRASTDPRTRDLAMGPRAVTA